MADKNQLKTASQTDFADDDPFAELTRIMGFDPRQPVKRPEPVQAANMSRPQVGQAQPAAGMRQAPAESPDDDFSLDLEKELLGSFDLEGEDASAAAYDAGRGDDIFAEAPTRPHDTDINFDFSDDLDAALAAAGAPAEPRRQHHDELDEDLHAAFAATAPETRSTAAADEFDLGLTDDDFHGLGDLPGASAPAAPRAGDVVEPDLDAAISGLGSDFRASGSARADRPDADLDFDLFDEQDFRLPHEPAAGDVNGRAGSEAAGDPAQAGVKAESGPADEFDAEHDFELGDLQDDGFEPEGAASHHAGAQSGGNDRGIENPSFGDVDFGFEHFGSDEGADYAAPSVEPPVVAESSLENKSKPLFEFSVPAYVPRKLPTSPMDVAAEEVRQRNASTPDQTSEEFNLEDELNALLGNAKADRSPALPTSPAVSAVSPAQASSYEPPLSYGASSVHFGEPEQDAPAEDELSWDFGADFAAEEGADAGEEPSSEPTGSPAEGYADREDVGVPSTFADDAGYDLLDEPINLDEVMDELDEHPTASAAPDDRFGRFTGLAALAPAAAGIAARPGEPPRATAGVAPRPAASPHRDPVVRADPMKEDPLNKITQLTEEYSRRDGGSSRAAGAAAGAAASAAYYPEDEIAGQLEEDFADAFDGQPEIETIEVSDKAVALADDFEIPELPEEDDVPPASGYDDLDAEFSSLINEMNTEPGPAVPPARSTANGFAKQPHQGAAAGAVAAAASAAPPYAEGPEPGSFGMDAGDMRGPHAPGAPYAQDDYEFEADFDEEAPQYMAAQDRPNGRSRGLLIGGVIAAVAVIGGIGAFALSFGGGEEAPALVRADDSPVKVRPENPGGTTVPNQDSKAYETVAGETAATAPQQESLVTTAEEPVDVSLPAIEEDDGEMASGKSEDRIEQIVQDAETQSDAEIAAVAPRKVRTLVVRPDGTLVQREDEPSEPSGETAASATAAPVSTAPTAAEAISDAPALAPSPTQAQIPDAPAAETASPSVASVQADAPVEAPAGRAAMPDTAPIAPLRPVDQPVDVVGEVKPDQVAAVAAPSASTGSWAMQIASQPSEAAAQSSYQDLARRYGSVLQGREVNIVKAEIEGKGTFWRVRVPANTRNEAVSLCEQYKAAGGNCFVSR
jgi:hypothetical protein